MKEKIEAVHNHYQVIYFRPIMSDRLFAELSTKVLLSEQILEIYENEILTCSALLDDRTIEMLKSITRYKLTKILN